MNAGDDRITRVTNEITRGGGGETDTPDSASMPTPFAPVGLEGQCIVCALIVPYTFDPLFCQDCMHQPFSTPESRASAAAALGLPEGQIVLSGTVPGTGLSPRYEGTAMVFQAVPWRVALIGEPQERARFKAGDPGAAARMETVEWLPVRELVLFRDTTMFVEVRWRPELNDHRAFVHNLDHTGLVAPGKGGKTRPGGTPRLLKLATDMLALTTPPGRRPTEEELRRRMDVVRRAEEFRAQHPGLAWDVIAKHHLGVRPGTLDDYRRQVRVGQIPGWTPDVASETIGKRRRA